MRIVIGRTIFAQTPFLIHLIFFANNRAGLEESADDIGSVVPWLLQELETPHRTNNAFLLPSTTYIAVEVVDF